MLCNCFQLVCLFITLVVVGDVHLLAQSGTAEPQVQVRKRRIDWDRNRWVFARWTTSPPSHTNIEADENLTVRENVQKLVNRQQFEALEAAFAKRKQVDDEAHLKIASFEYAERFQLRKSEGWKDEDLNRFRPPLDWKEPTSEEKIAALKEYLQTQDKAEKLWVSQIDEILPPETYVKVAAFFVQTGNSFLASELFASLLHYDQPLRSKVELLCQDYQQDLIKFKKKLGSLKKGEEVKPKDMEEIKESLDRPYSVLAPEQFKQVAVISGLKTKDETWTQFRDRISLDSAAGEKILKPLIDRIIAELDK